MRWQLEAVRGRLKNCSQRTSIASPAARHPPKERNAFDPLTMDNLMLLSFGCLGAMNAGMLGAVGAKKA